MGIGFIGHWLGRSVKTASSSTASSQAAEPEDAESQFNLGGHFADGEDAVQDLQQAVRWYQKAAGQGHVAAQFKLGLMYGQGQGVVRNEVTAVAWLLKAAELGHAGAQYHLGVRKHRASKGSQATEAGEYRVDAFKWLELAVAQGYRGAESAREFVALGMTRDEVEEGGRRAQAYLASRRDEFGFNRPVP